MTGWVVIAFVVGFSCGAWFVLWLVPNIVWAENMPQLKWWKGEDEHP